MTDKAFACFGYGSLVNRQTLATEYHACCPARLRGWRRHWQSRGPDIEPAHADEIALLSVHRHAGSVIDGMLLVKPFESLPALDLREARYERVRIDRAELAPAQGEFDFAVPDELYVYVGLPTESPVAGSKLLQSYLDAVLAGFLVEFGEPGLDRFFASTIGFELPLIADRAVPRYPRAVRLEPRLAAEFDRRLAAAGARVGG